MSKIVIIGFANLYAMPYAKKYIEAIKEEQYKYDFIFWDRDNIGESANNYFVFRKQIDSSINVARKLKSFYQFRKFVKNVLKRNKYEKIIVLYSIPAVLLNRYLKKNYKNKYIFVYTDYTFERNCIYKNILAKVVKDSYITTVTSQGFLRYLPKSNNVFISHNIDNSALYKYNIDYRTDDKTININYIGMLRQFDYIRKFLEIFKNDRRFKLHYHGNGFCEKELNDYVVENNIYNVFVHGKYQPEQKCILIQKTDIINNCFANDMFQKYAMTNRFYDAVLNNKPQMTTKGSFSQQVIKEYNIGFIFDIEDEKIKEKLYSWFINLDNKEFKKKCEIYYKEIYKEIKFLDAKIQDFLLTNRDKSFKR